ncbi:uncharacterized mitochondrial protein AtMg00240-like [Capsicum annuum]|uniref:uncharacterized mitochondrial protein AtMg00240-like n=1 Tax=Capsicum annuum TaxID=4072 RepID=UPI001FB0A405|nr:uncharacterized mitochondrial protein AtMg00240-like [Capsicum annuum]
MSQSKADHSVFYRHNGPAKNIFLIVYVNDIVLAGNGPEGIWEPLKDPGRYRRLVSKLNYLTIKRPNISFTISVVSQFLQAPCKDHWDVVIRILRYIKKAPGQGLLYEDKGHTDIVGYSDADWAGSPSDKRSTSGYCVMI